MPRSGKYFGETITVRAQAQKIRAPRTVEGKLKSIVAYVLCVDELEITGSFSIMDDPKTVDAHLDPIEIAVMAEKEFKLPECEWPDSCFSSFASVLACLESHLECPVLAHNGPQGAI